jgi:hypothetical protein
MPDSKISQSGDTEQSPPLSAIEGLDLNNDPKDEIYRLLEGIRNNAELSKSNPPEGDDGNSSDSDPVS